jgi:hypothetical protein
LTSSSKTRIATRALKRKRQQQHSSELKQLKISSFFGNTIATKPRGTFSAGPSHPIS